MARKWTVRSEFQLTLSQEAYAQPCTWTGLLANTNKFQNMVYCDYSCLVELCPTSVFVITLENAAFLRRQHQCLRQLTFHRYFSLTETLALEGKGPLRKHAAF